MAAARKSCSYDFNVSNNSRTFPTQAQSPRIAPSIKPLREVGKQQNIPLEPAPIGAPREQLDQPSHTDYFICDWFRREIWRLGRDLTAPKSPGFDTNGSPRTGHDTRSQSRRDSNHGDLAGRHEFRSSLWSDGPGYGNVDAKGPSTISPAACLLETSPDTQPETLFPRRSRLFLYDDPVVSSIRPRVIYKPTNDQDSEKEHREKWTQIVRFCYSEAAGNGVLAGRVDKQIDAFFFLKNTSSQNPCNSTSSTNITGSYLLNHSIGEETVEPNELDLFGRDWIHRWKDGAGRNKDWRSSRYLRCLRKGERAKCQLLPSGRRLSPRNLYQSKAASHHLAITHSAPHIAVPKDMLRQKSTSCQGHSSCLMPKSTWQAMNDVGLNTKTKSSAKSSTRCEPWMNDPIDSLDAEESWRSEDRFNTNPEVSNARIDDLLNAMVSTHTEPSSPRFKTSNAKNISLNHLLAPESFVDTILGACLRLKRILRTEPHYEVYDVESLSDKNQKYGVRAYNLRGLSPKVRNSRIRNLKRASARSSYIDTLEQGAKKWLIFADDGADLVPEPFRDCDTLWYTREEYFSAFPALEPRRPYNPEKTEKEAFQNAITLDAYYTSFAEALQQELLKLGPWQALEVINRVRERLLASSKSWNNDDTVKPLSVKQKKIKSPEQAKRLRDRQRHSRQKTRMANTALKLGANSDSYPQTLDIAPETLTETSSGNETSHVAADEAIAIQVQEDNESSCFCDVCRNYDRMISG